MKSELIRNEKASYSFHIYLILNIIIHYTQFRFLRSVVLDLPLNYKPCINIHRYPSHCYKQRWPILVALCHLVDFTFASKWHVDFLPLRQ